MKIIYLHQYFNTPEMAGGTRSYEMAKRLVSMGHEVHIVTSNRDADHGTDWYLEEIDGIFVHWLPVPYSNKMIYSARLRAFAQFAFESGRKAIAIGGDVVYATSTPLTIAIPGVRASRRLRVPMVFEVRDLWPEVPIAVGIIRNPVLVAGARWLERFAYRNSERVVALSPGMAEGVIRTGYTSDKVIVIPNSADLSLFAPDDYKATSFREAYPEIGSGPIVLYPGSLGFINGVKYFPRMASEVLPVRPDVRFVVLGDGMEWDLVRDEAKALGVLDVNFFQYRKVPKVQVVNAFSAAAVIASFVIDVKELWSNSANKFFDALASEKPVAINYSGWQRDLLERHGAGVFLSPDPVLGAKVLLDFMGNPDRLKRAGFNAGALGRNEFSRDALAKQLEAALLAARGI